MQEIGKNPEAFKNISEAAEVLGVPAYVLRFWEAKFPQVTPLKLGGRRRYYTPEDIRLLGAIKRLLYQDGYTIKGVQKIIEDKGVDGLISASGAGAEEGDGGPDESVLLEEILNSLELIEADLEKALK